VALADSTVTLEVYGWVDQRSTDYFKVASEGHRLVKSAFDEAGIEMPAPTHRLEFDGNARVDAGAAETPREVRQETGPAPEDIDVTVDDAVAEQVEEELARDEEADLLEEGAKPSDA
jgi:hypothetical protein